MTKRIKKLTLIWLAALPALIALTLALTCATIGMARNKKHEQPVVIRVRAMSHLVNHSTDPNDPWTWASPPTYDLTELVVDEQTSTAYTLMMRIGYGSDMLVEGQSYSAVIIGESPKRNMVIFVHRLGNQGKLISLKYRILDIRPWPGQASTQLPPLEEFK
jgi:hypothetical protein